MIDPREVDLLRTLEQASQHAGKEQAGREAWGDLLEAVAHQSEGWQQQERELLRSHRAVGYVTVAWWRDHQGRKHVRVAGGDTSRRCEHLHHTRMDEDERPPLWHICPERVFRVTREDAHPAWLVSCACGETGRPADLGWMGTRCAACHDRRVDGEILEHEDHLHLLQTIGPIRGLTFDPAGERLALVTPYEVSTSDLRTGLQTLYHAEPNPDPQKFPGPLVISPDGQHLAAGDSRLALVRVWSLVGDEGVPDSQLTLPSGTQALGLAFAQDSRFLAGYGNALKWFVWERGRASWKVALCRADGASAFAFSPDGETFALGDHGGGLRFLDTSTWHDRDRLSLDQPSDAEVLHLEYTSDGRCLILITGHPLSGLAPWQLQRFHLGRGTFEQQVTIPPQTTLVCSPDCRYAALVGGMAQQSAARIRFWDLEKWIPLGSLEWNPEITLGDLAFSADAQTLAIGTVGGVVLLCPWRRLLSL